MIDYVIEGRGRTYIVALGDDGRDADALHSGARRPWPLFIANQIRHACRW